MVNTFVSPRRFVLPRILLMFLAFAMMSTVVYGFAAANTVPDSGAGDGEGTISGYTISNIGYTLDSDDPQTLASVKFDIAADEDDVSADLVKVRLDESTTTWYDCTVAAGTATCSVAGTEIKVVDADTLTVVAISEYE